MSRDIFAETRAKIAFRAELAKHPRPLTGPTRAGGMMLISRDPSRRSEWRVTRFDADGEPLGHFGPAPFATVLQAAEDHGDLRRLGEPSL